MNIDNRRSGKQSYPSVGLWQREQRRRMLACDHDRRRFSRKAMHAHFLVYESDESLHLVKMVLTCS